MPGIGDATSRALGSGCQYTVAEGEATKPDSVCLYNKIRDDPYFLAALSDSFGDFY